MQLGCWLGRGTHPVNLSFQAKLCFSGGIITRSDVHTPLQSEDRKSGLTFTAPDMLTGCVYLDLVLRVAA